jgi:hypothetical protein
MLKARPPPWANIAGGTPPSPQPFGKRLLLRTRKLLRPKALHQRPTPHRKTRLRQLQRQCRARRMAHL